MFRLPTAAAASFLTATLVSALHATPAAALPDLVPEIFNVSVSQSNVLAGDVEEGCAGGQLDRRLVKFSLRTRNTGPDDLVLGDPGCPNCSLNPGATCTNPLFVCGTSHGHAHFGSFAKTEILDSGGNVVAEGEKYGFCLLDTECAERQYTCSYQGLSAGCGDVYSAGLPCQYVDITDDGLGDGTYTLRVSIDPDAELPDADRTNNTAALPFTIGGTAAVCPSFESADVPKTIPDPGSATSTITLPDLGPLVSLRVRLAGTHPWMSELEASLESPAATTRTLFSGICGSSDDFDLYLGDGAIDGLVCPAVDPLVVRTSHESFSPLHGEETAGNWTLTVSDQVAAHGGSLTGWSLEVCAACGNGVLDDDELCDDGNASDGDCCSWDCQTASADGIACEDGNLCTTSESCVAGNCEAGAPVECDPCLVCDASEGCVVPDIEYPCQHPPPAGSLLQLRHDDLEPGRDSLLWKWRSEIPLELDEFGAPEAVTGISLCIYAGDALALSATIPAAPVCDGAPCWKRGEHDAAFRDPASRFDGLSSVRIRDGSRGRIVIRGRGEALGTSPLFQSLPITVRLRRSDGMPCWEAGYDELRTSTDVSLRARSR